MILCQVPIVLVMWLFFGGLHTKFDSRGLAEDDPHSEHSDVTTSYFLGDVI